MACEMACLRSASFAPSTTSGLPTSAVAAGDLDFAVPFFMAHLSSQNSFWSWHHGSLVRCWPTDPNTEKRLVIPSNSFTCLLRLMSCNAQPAVLHETYRPTSAPRPVLDRKST